MEENLDLIKNVDIKEALKEFEEKSKIEQTQKAPEVLPVSKAPKMTALVMKWFGVEERPAEYILLGLAVLMIMISLFLIFGGGQELEKIEENPILPTVA